MITDLSTGNVIKPLQQLDHGALATPTGTNKGKCLTNLNLQAKVIQHLHE
jgi:hypothetical protein